MKTIRIFISSPGDVHEERARAGLVIEQLQRRYAGRLRLQPLLWEEMPLRADSPFQNGIDSVLGEDGIDIAIFILWSRLGSPLGPDFRKEDGTPYRSGTEYEFDRVMSAVQKAHGKKPTVLVYLRDDEPRFREGLAGRPASEMADSLLQRQLVDDFIRNRFHDHSAGYSTGAYHRFANPNALALRLREHLRQVLDQILPEAARPESPWMGEPFRGLEPFSVEHADVFFGREQEVCDIELALQEQAAAGCAFVLIVGASGSGKSSLARAGVLADLKTRNTDPGVTRWIHAILQPGEHQDPVHGLARVVLESSLPEGSAPANARVGELAEALVESGPAVGERLADCLGGAQGSARIILLVDQLEELFTHHASAGNAINSFFAALKNLASSGHIWVLATVRADFYASCQACPDLMAMKNRHGQYDLLPLGAAQLPRIISQPVWLAGLRYEQHPETHKGLDQRIFEDTNPHPEALPLLEYLLRELYERRTPDGMLTFQEYESLGGVEGALGKRAEEVFQRLSQAAKDALPEVLQELATISDDETLAIVRKRANRAEATDRPEKQELVDAFVRERLLITDKGPDGQAIVHVAHEALLTRWDRAARWSRGNREFLLARSRVEEARAHWKVENENSDFLLQRGKALVDAQAILADHGRWLSEDLRDYIRRSSDFAQRNEQKRIRRLRATIAALSVLTTAALIGGWIAWTQKNVAVSARKDAEQQKQVAQTSEAKALDQRALAMRAVNDLVFTTQRELMGSSQHAATREKLLMIAKENLSRLTEENMPAGLGTQRSLAAVLMQLGDLALEAGRPADALGHYTQARRAFAELAVGTGESSQARRDVVVIDMRLAKAHLANGSPGVAGEILSHLSADALNRPDDANALALLRSQIESGSPHRQSPATRTTR